MIKIKSEREIALLKEAGRIVALCHAEMKKCVKPGVVVITSQGRKFELTYPADLLTFSTDVQTDLNPGLKKYWGESLTRINLTSAEDAPLSGTYIIKLRAL